MCTHLAAKQDTNSERFAERYQYSTINPALMLGSVESNLLPSPMSALLDICVRTDPGQTFKILTPVPRATSSHRKASIQPRTPALAAEYPVRSPIPHFPIEVEVHHSEEIDCAKMIQRKMRGSEFISMRIFARNKTQHFVFTGHTDMDLRARIC